MTATIRPLRPLRPAAARPRNEPLPVQPRDRVPSACDQCRLRKIKCNGDRPACLECTKRSATCHYAARSTETQNQALKRKFTILQAENEAYAELFEMMRTGSESEAWEVMRRVRMGGGAGGVEDVVKGIKEVGLLARVVEQRGDDASRVRYALPSLASIVSENCMFMPDNPYFASSSSSSSLSLLSSSGSQAEYHHLHQGKRSEFGNNSSGGGSDAAAQYPSPPL